MLLKYILIEFGWQTFRSLFNVFRWIWWSITGVTRQLADASPKVHVRKIHLRHVYDEYLTPLTERVFLTTHEGFEEAEYVLRDDVTLWDVTESHAYFVQCSKNVFDPRNGAFMPTAQFHCAERLLVMSIRTLHALAEHIRTPSTIICIAHPPRSGSTLFGQIFQHGANCRTWSEPSCLMALLSMRNRPSVKGDEFERLVRSVVLIMCKPDRHVTEHEQPSGYVLKLAGTWINLMRSLHRVFPSMHHIFLYRNIVPTVRSLNKLIAAYSVTAQYYYLAERNLADICLPNKRKPRCSSMTEVSTMLTISIMNAYLNLRASALPVVAVKYEDLIARKLQCCRQLMNHVGLSFNAEMILEAYNTDSQAASAFSQTAMSKVNTDVLTPERLEWMRRALTLWDMQEDLLENIVLLGTLTGEEE